MRQIKGEHGPALEQDHKIQLNVVQAFLKCKVSVVLQMVCHTRHFPVQIIYVRKVRLLILPIARRTLNGLGNVREIDLNMLKVVIQDMLLEENAIVI